MTTKATPKAETVTKATPPAHTLVLSGKPATLKRSASAMMKLSQAFGGLVPAIQRIQQFDMNAIGTIVHIGLGRSTVNAKDVERTIAEVCNGSATDAANVAAGYLSDLMAAPAGEG